MGSLTSANGSVQPVDDETSGDANAAGFAVNDGTTVAVSGSSDQPVTFAAATGTLALDNSSSFSGQISGFGGGDQIDLSDIFFGASTTLAYSARGNDLGTTLTVSDGTDTANLVLFGQYLASDFAISSDGHGGTLITDPLPPAPTVANGPTVVSDGANSTATQAGALNINNSSASPVMLSAAVEQAPSEITAGLMMAYSMSDEAFGVVTATATATTSDTAASSGGSAFGVVTNAMPDVAPASDGVGFVVNNAGLSSGNPVANVITQNSGLVSVGAASGAPPDPAAPLQNTWQQNLALMGNYMASTFPPQASTDGGSPDPGASLTAPAQGALAAQVLADHRNSS
jgi:hypothetical protein